MTAAEIQTLINAAKSSEADLVTWTELRAILEGLKNQEGEEGDYTLDMLGDVDIDGFLDDAQVLRWNGTAWVNEVLTTDDIAEGDNLFFTTSRSRNAISGGTGISYNPATGVINSTITQYTSTMARAAISLTTSGIGAATYDSSTGVLNIPTPSSVNIYNSNGTLTGNRTVTSGGFNLTFTGINTASSGIARGLNLTHTLVAAANNDVLVGLDINPTFTNGAFTGVQNIALRVNGVTRTNGLTLNGNLFSFGNATGEIVYENYPNNTSDVVFRVWNTTGVRSQFRATAAGGYTFAPNNGVQLTIHPNGNVGFGTGVDAGFRLDVNGTMRVQGNLSVNLLSSNLAAGIAIGNANTLSGGTFTGGSNIAIGADAFSTVSGGNVQNNVAIGSFAFRGQSRGYFNVAIGYQALDGSACYDQNTVIGEQSLKGAGASSTYYRLSVLGGSIQSSAANAQYSIGLGWGARLTGSNQFVAGGLMGPILDIFFGSGAQRDGSSAGAGSSYTIHGSGAFGTDFAGGNITIAGGRGTGTGTPGDVIFSTATATTTGTTLQTLTNRWWVKGGTGQLANLSTPHASAIFQIDSTTRGVLLPRMDTTQQNAITSMATGLILYNTTSNTLEVFDGTAWRDVLAASFVTINHTNSRIGINATSPARTLTIVGDASISDDFFAATASGKTATFGATGDSSYRVSIDGDLRVFGKIRTAAPDNGSGPGIWKLGSSATGTFTLNTAQCLEIEMNGTLYRIATLNLA